MHPSRHAIALVAAVLPLVLGCQSPAERAFSLMGDCQANHQELVGLLDAHPELARATRSDGDTLLYLVTMSGDCNLALRLMELGADPRGNVLEADTPLHYAADWGSVPLVNRLLAAGADPNAECSEGETPLAWAAGEGHLDVVKRLLREEPGIDAVDWALVAASFEIADFQVPGITVTIVGKLNGAPHIEAVKSVVPLLHDYRSGLAGRSTLWHGAVGVGADRMTGRSPSEVYRALWKQGDRQYLVCLQYPGMDLFGRPYGVLVFDRDMRVVRRGEIIGYDPSVPYGLVEIRDAPNVSSPDGVSGWRLAVIAYDFDKGVTANKILMRDATTDTVSEGDGILTVLVEWEGEQDPDARYLFELSPFPASRIRWAEPGVSPLFGQRGARE
jgi:Ankyrin repeats (3 copies)